jgi:hypothetical protein
VDQAAILQRLRDAQAQGGDALGKIVGHEEAAKWGGKQIGDDYGAAVAAFGASDLDALGGGSGTGTASNPTAPAQAPPTATLPGGPAPTAPGMVQPPRAGNTAPAMVAGAPRPNGAGFAGVQAGGGRGGNLGTRPTGGTSVDVFMQVAAAQGGRMY